MFESLYPEVFIAPSSSPGFVLEVKIIKFIGTIKIVLQKKKAVIKLIILFIYKTDLIKIRFDFDELESPIHVFN